MKLGRICKRGRGDSAISILGFNRCKAPSRASASNDAGQRFNLILCQITSRLVSDEYAVNLEASDFSSGSLKQSSNIRPNRLFTADQGLILYAAGRLKQDKLTEAIDKVIELLQA